MTDSTLPAPAGFDQALEAFTAARAALNAQIGDDMDAPAVERLSDAYSAAVDRLLATPAPDAPALLEKLRVVFEDDGDDCLPVWPRAELAQTVRDAERLLIERKRPWDRLRAEVERLETLAAADLAFGRTWQANEAHSLAMETDQEATAFAAAQEAEQARARDFLSPYWRACTALLHCPAPDPEALRYKVDLVTRAGFESGDPDVPDPFALIAADAERLAGACG